MSAAIGWLADPQRVLQLMRLALAAAALLVLLSEVSLRRRDERRRGELLAASAREAEGLPARQAGWVASIEGWLDAETRLDGEPLVDPSLREPGALQAIARGPWVYLRGVAGELGRDESRLQAARASSHDAFALCLRERPGGDDRALRAAQETYRLHGFRFEDAVAGIEPAGELLFALRPRLRSWPLDVRQAEGSLGLTLLENELQARPEALRRRAQAAAELRHLLLVVDRPTDAVAAPRTGRGLMASLQPSRLLELEYLPHEAQVTLIDLVEGRPLLRLRRWLDERPLLERDARVNVGWAQSCRLALEAHAQTE